MTAHQIDNRVFCLRKTNRRPGYFITHNVASARNDSVVGGPDIRRNYEGALLSRANRFSRLALDSSFLCRKAIQSAVPEEQDNVCSNHKKVQQIQIEDKIIMIQKLVDHPADIPDLNG